jgi:hypothetical protein
VPCKLHEGIDPRTPAIAGACLGECAWVPATMCRECSETFETFEVAIQVMIPHMDATTERNRIIPALAVQQRSGYEHRNSQLQEADVYWLRECSFQLGF